jgi:hypothetical protein
MELRDLGRMALVVIICMSFNLVLAIFDLRTPSPADYDRACAVAALSAILWAIREKRSIPPEESNL